MRRALALHRSHQSVYLIDERLIHQQYIWADFIQREQQLSGLMERLHNAMLLSQLLCQPRQFARFATEIEDLLARRVRDARLALRRLDGLLTERGGQAINQPLQGLALRRVRRGVAVDEGA